MEEREKLLLNLEEALSIINRLAGVQQSLNRVRSQYRTTSKNQKVGVIGKIIIGLSVFFSLIMIISGISGFSSMSAESQGIGMGVLIVNFVMAIGNVAVVYLIIHAMNKSKNKSINLNNQRIMQNNENLKVQEQAVLNELRDIQIVYNERLLNWYPQNYCYVSAVEFFYDSVKNFRADSMKEAINLYENYMHQQRVEENQKQSIKQQKLNNLLAAGNLVLQGAQLGAMNENNAAINRNTRAVNDLHSSINPTNASASTYHQLNK
jgi:large-conductance mechanosensitive channel